MPVMLKKANVKNEWMVERTTDRRLAEYIRSIIRLLVYSLGPRRTAVQRILQTN